MELAPRVSLAELREECARVRAAADPDPEATNRRIHAQRRLRHYRDGEGGWNLSARGTAHAGAAFVTVLNAITDPPSPPPAARAATNRWRPTPSTP